MKAFLTWITLMVTVAVVIVLAIYLILIASALMRANRDLEQLVNGLEAIRNNTAPLADDLTAINNAATTLRDQLHSLDGYLQEIAGIVQG
ncbi:MAG: hypothetical protein M5U01_35990 [Ardenticatenaceae bacterium]|nr:hypothetical protein [Ardenticatenaceae bacterium]HBY97559.1 hypothetical protein [Chloroflexota bacterium]